MIENYRMLAYAIIAQAATDYIECVKYLLFKGSGHTELDIARINWCLGNIHSNEAFFLSPRFDLLADRGTDGQALIELLKKRANEDYKECLKTADGYHKAEMDNELYIGRMSGIHKRWKKKKKVTE